jgi:hypothetical protein
MCVDDSGVLLFFARPEWLVHAISGRLARERSRTADF